MEKLRKIAPSILQNGFGKRSGVLVSVLDLESSGLGSRRRRDYCVMFFGKTLVQTYRGIGGGWGRGSRNTPSRFENRRLSSSSMCHCAGTLPLNLSIRAKCISDADKLLISFTD